jgi:hypothetical protein
MVVRVPSAANRTTVWATSRILLPQRACFCT